mmetsp:Transcript_14933/g.32563  ORF Transcript_14933/g.32563 Transcript_14933/m.32563 type:complete len:433 (+) Transcript_14933:115-1413(+)
MILPIILSSPWLLAGITTAFQFPKIKFDGISTKEDLNAPHTLVKNSPEQAENLRRRLENYCDISSGDEVLFCWEPTLRKSNEVADVIFQGVARVLREQYKKNQQPSVKKRTVSSLKELILSFPSMSQPADLHKLSAVLQSDECKQFLGVDDVCAELYPSSPAPYLRIQISNVFAEGQTTESAHNSIMNASMPVKCAKSSTESWVNKFLGKYRLCPYTCSTSRAAVGLLSVGVPEGAVRVRVESTNAENVSRRSYDMLRAAQLVSSFWSEVVCLMDAAQEDWATSLIVFPEYDTEFESFVDICDGIIEPTVVATHATNSIGRAWFHPNYDADAVGHTEVIAGHAIPHKMVEGFMESLNASGGRDDQISLGYAELVEANNRVRKTPHATINILRRSQLSAAGQYEKGLGKRQPKPNSIYVRNAKRLSKLSLVDD